MKVNTTAFSVKISQKECSYDGKTKYIVDFHYTAPSGFRHRTVRKTTRKSDVPKIMSSLIRIYKMNEVYRKIKGYIHLYR